MDKQNCPNCGAIISEEKCPYCGTLFYDFSTISMDKPCFIKVRIGNKIMRLLVRPQSFTIEQSCDTHVYYADNKAVHYMPSELHQLSLDFMVLPHENDKLNVNDAIAEVVDLDDISSDTQAW